VRRVGILMPFADGDAEYGSRVLAFRRELERLGWNEANVEFDERWTTDNMDRVRAGAASLLASQPDVVVAIGGRVVPILMQLSRSVPIVIPGTVDPVGTGWVESLARPGGNVTGYTSLELSMFGKSLEILKQIAPVTSRVGLIYNSANPTSAVFRRAIDGFAGRLRIEPVDLPIHQFADIEPRDPSREAQWQCFLST
jgi:putative ABC transport system substrate-binding protein